jgi:nitrite reductase (NADH) small subunit/3-phenylpropionate/trans-cinnamate dioxygenase ferredoxin subunit
MPISGFVRVLDAADLSPGRGRVVDVGGRNVALFNHAGTFRAIDDLCPHMGGSLGEGSLDGETVVCPWHGWEFSVRSGQCPDVPRLRVACYAVRIEDGGVWVSEAPATPASDP